MLKKRLLTLSSRRSNWRLLKKWNTFADYAAQQEARQNIANAVLGHTYALCEALRQNFIDYSIRLHKRGVEMGDNAHYHIACIDKLRKGICDYEFYPETGRKYHKIIMDVTGSRSVHAFVDKNTGEVYKPASWKSPAKHVRFNLLDKQSRDECYRRANWSGSYLYKWSTFWFYHVHGHGSFSHFILHGSITWMIEKRIEQRR